MTPARWVALGASVVAGAAHTAPAAAQASTTTNAWDAAHASAAVTICLRASGTPGAITDEALHRIEAELSASGFLVDQLDPDAPRACAMNDPSIKLRTSPGGIEIAASAGPTDDPVLQSVSTSDATTTAELVAIRAVEGLRAAMMQALRRSPSGAEGAPEAVRRFTRQDDPTPTESPPEGPSTRANSDPTQTTRPTQPGVSKSGSSSPPLDLLMTLGASLVLDGADPGMNGALHIAWLLQPLALGVGIEAGIVPGSWHAAAGSVELRPFGITGSVAARMPCGKKWECHAGALAGLRQFSMSATSEMGGVPGAVLQENHASAVLMVDALAGYFPVPRWGFFLRAQGGLLLDAPELDVGAETLTWGRPSLAFGAGAAARF